MARRRVVIDKSEPLHDDRAFLGYADSLTAVFKVDRGESYFLAILSDCAHQPFEIGYGTDKAARDRMFARIIDESQHEE